MFDLVYIWFRFHLLRFSILCVSSVSLDNFTPLLQLLAFVVLGLVSLVPSREIDWDEHFQIPASSGT